MKKYGEIDFERIAAEFPGKLIKTLQAAYKQRKLK